jgi:hypothetical protein
MTITIAPPPAQRGSGAGPSSTKTGAQTSHPRETPPWQGDHEIGSSHAIAAGCPSSTRRGLPSPAEFQRKTSRARSGRFMRGNGGDRMTVPASRRPCVLADGDEPRASAGSVLFATAADIRSRIARWPSYVPRNATIKSRMVRKRRLHGQVWRRRRDIAVACVCFDHRRSKRLAWSARLARRWGEAAAARGAW